MPSDPPDDRIEERVHHAQSSAGDDSADTAATEESASKVKVKAHTAHKARKPKPSAKRTVEHEEEAEAAETGERLHGQAADFLAAARERIVEHPVEAVLIAAAAGAAFAILLGAARR